MQGFYTAYGKYYDAKIAEVFPDGTFLVSWDDGGPSDRKKTAAEIKPRA